MTLFTNFYMATMKTKTNYPSDEKKHNHRDAFKGHKTKKHFLNTVKDKEASEEIKEEAFKIKEEK